MFRKLDPTMLGSGPYRYHRRRKIRISKGPDGYPRMVRKGVTFPVNGCAAIWTKMTITRQTGRGGWFESLAFTDGFFQLSVFEIGRHTENRARSYLAFQAVTGHYDLRITDNARSELSAGASGFSCHIHRPCSVLSAPQSRGRPGSGAVIHSSSARRCRVTAFGQTRRIMYRHDRADPTSCFD